MPSSDNNEQFIQAGTFIPEEPNVVPEDSPSKEASASVSDLFLLISIILLSVSLASAAGVYLYNRYIESKIAQSKDSLTLAAKNTTPETIEELNKMSKQLSAAKFVLDRHIAISQLFRALEEHTLKNVQITKLQYKFEGDTPKIMIDGLASSMNTLAAQSKELSKTKSKFLNVIFSGFDYDKSGYVKFKVDAEMNKNYMNFTNKVLQGLSERGSSSANTGTQNAGFTQASNFKQEKSDEFGLPE